MERWHMELAEHGGKNCSGESTMVQRCNVQDCPTTTTTTTTTTTIPTTTTRYRFQWGHGNTVKEEKNSDNKNFQPFNPFALLSALLFLWNISNIISFDNCASMNYQLKRNKIIENYEHLDIQYEPLWFSLNFEKHLFLSATSMINKRCE